MSTASAEWGAPPPSIGRALPGDHLCHVVEAPGEAESVAAGYIAGALERGFAALWIHGGSEAAALGALAFAQADPGAARASGALSLAPAAGVFPADGRFDEAALGALWAAARARTAEAGRPGLFVAMECRPPAGAAAARLVEWEAGVGAPAAASALCQFERALFPPELLRSLIRVHPMVLHRARIMRNPEVFTADAALAREPAGAEVTRLLAAMHERARADQALRASERLHRLLTENAPDLIFRYRLAPAPGFEYVSGASTAMVGYTPEEHYADPELGAKLVHPDDRALLAKAFSGPSAPVVLRFVHRDGRVIWTEQRVVLLRDEAGRPVAVEGVSRDVTARVHADEQVRESEERLRFALECAGHAYWELDVGADRVLRGTPWTLLGYGADELGPGLDAWCALVHPDDLPARAAALAAYVEGRTPEYRAEFRARARDGSWRWLRSAGRRLPGGGRARLAGTLTDVTTTHEVAERARASERLASIGTLAGGLAHEVNNPLAALVASLAHAREALAAGESQGGALAAALDDALHAAGRVGGVVRALRQFATPGRRTGPARVDVRAELLAAAGITRNEISHRARFVAEIPDALPPVVAEPGELGQVFVNLLLNAAQAIPEGAPGDVRLEAAADGGRVVVRVSDTGVGMAPEVAARAFEPFFTTRDVGRGTGLGLAVAHGVVTSAGGALALESAPGRGTCVTVSLPAAPPLEAAPAPPPAAPAPAPAVRPRVLVVDDEPLVGRSLARLLRAAHDVTVLESAAEAHRRLAAGERWDAIVCDLMMPELSGMDLEDRLRADAPDVVPRIVYMTGGAFTDRARDFLDAGRPWLEKPADPAALRAAVGERIRAGRGEGAAP